jgi:hypothetical protein
MIYAHIHNNSIEIIHSPRSKNSDTLRELRQKAFKPLKGELLQVATTDIPQLIAKKTIPTPEGYKFDGVDSFIPMTMREKYDAGLIDKKTYNDHVISERKQEYRNKTDGIYLEIIYDAMKAGKEPDLTPWIEAVDNVKESYEKIDESEEQTEK